MAPIAINELSISGNAGNGGGGGVKTSKSKISTKEVMELESEYSA